MPFLFFFLFSDMRIRNAISSAKSSNLTDETFLKAIETLSHILGETQHSVQSFQQQLTLVRREQQQLLGQQGFMAQNRDWVVLTIILVFQAVVQWVFK